MEGKILGLNIAIEMYRRVRFQNFSRPDFFQFFQGNSSLLIALRSPLGAQRGIEDGGGGGGTVELI